MTPDRKRYDWFRLMRHPFQGMAGQYAGYTPRFTIIPMLLGGILLIQLWADLFNLATKYAPGQIMALSLIVGPILGTLLAMTLTTTKTAFGRIFLLPAAGRTLPRRLQTGGHTWSRNLVVHFNCAGPFIPLALIALVEFWIDNGAQFFPAQGHTIFLVLKLTCFAYYLLLWFSAFKAAYRAQGPWFALASSLALLSGIAIATFLTWFFGLPFFP